MKNKLLILLFTLAIFNIVPIYADNLEEATAIYNEAIDKYKADEVNGSIELFNKAISLEPEFYEANYNLAQILMSVGRYEEAIKPLETILKSKPNDGETLYNLGKIQYKRGYLSKSFDYLNKIKESAPQYDSAKILLNKIEKRQEELNLELKISEHKNIVDSSGKAKSEELAEYQAPSGIAVDSKGNIYTASFSENSVHKISAKGQKTVLSKSGLIKGPIGVAVDKENNIYVANYTSNNIVKINSSNQVSVFAEVQKPYCMTYDGEHNRLYVTEQATNKLIKFDL